MVRGATNFHSWGAILAACFFVVCGSVLALPARGEPSHALAMHGDPSFTLEEFTHFAYTNPEAPKGGTLRVGVSGTYFNFNPFNIAAGRVSLVAPWSFQSLMTRSYDEPFTLYPALAMTAEMPDSRDWVEFTINPKARFSDGEQVTTDDVLFSWKLLRDHGRPNHRRYYANIAKVEIKDGGKIRFVFKDNKDRELPLIAGLMPILPRHATQVDRFAVATLEPMVGSGPYTISDFTTGEKIVFSRNPDFWAKDEPFAKGMYNFDKIELYYIRDSSALLDAFRLKQIDYRVESNPENWQTSFHFDENLKKDLVKHNAKTNLPKGMNGIVFNLRRPVFANKRLREVLISLYDFQFINSALNHNAYRRQVSFFEDSELSAVGVPASEAERALLAKFPGAVDDDIMAGTYLPPDGDGSGRNRRQIKAAQTTMTDLGYVLKEGKWADGQTGEIFSFTLSVTNSEEERIALAYQQMLARAGFSMEIQLVESAQYQTRRKEYDYDAIFNRWYVSLSPGNEQYHYWSASAGQSPGSRNYMGLAEPAVSAMIDAMIAARGREDLVTAARALDRVLMSSKSVIPLHYNPDIWVALWKRIQKPERDSAFGYVVEAWWDGKN